MKRAAQKKTLNKPSGPEIRELYNGDFVLVQGVSPFIAETIQGSIPDPEVPIVILEDGSEYPNANDPAYHKAVEEAEKMRSIRAIQGVMYFGLTLVNEEGEPINAPDNGWETRLKFVGVDWRAEFERVIGAELVEEDLDAARNVAYLYYIAVTGPDMDMVYGLLGVDREEAKRAQAMFQREA